MEGLGEDVNVLAGVVHGYRGTEGTRDTKIINERFGTMVTRAHGNALMVKQYAYIKGMNELSVRAEDIKRYGTCLRKSVGVDVYVVHGSELLLKIVGEVRLVGFNRLQANALDVSDSLSESVTTDEIGCACLELIGQDIVGGMVEMDVVNHLSPTLRRW